MLHNTPIHAVHCQSGAKMIDFHGWHMPLHYGSQLAEHHAVRNASGIFDVSHMTILDVLGAGGRQFLRYLLCNDVDKLHAMGRAIYSCLCNEYGGIIDDLIVYQRAPDSYRLVFNATTKNRVLTWMREKMAGFSIGIQERNDQAILAIQGPEALRQLQAILDPIEAQALSQLNRFECIDINQSFFARTGYSGEDGFEIMLPDDLACALWLRCIEQGIQPCGLGARNTLRLEAGMLLSGQDMDEKTTPLESGLAWNIEWSTGERNFIGMGALLAQQQRGTERRLVGLIAEPGPSMRPGQSVSIDGMCVGHITSGSFSPTLGQPIALARLLTHTASPVTVDVAGKPRQAIITKPPFISKKYAKKGRFDESK